MEISFDGSGSTDPDGNLTTHSWNFGDGDSDTGVTTTHTYLNPGAYLVTLTVTDNEGATGSTFVIVDIPADSDGDGLPDDFEDANGFDKNDAGDADLDDDGDGFSNLEEFLSATDPHDSNDAMKIISTEVTGSDIAVRFQTVGNMVYRLERNETYPNGTWEAVATQAGNGGVIEIIDPGAADLPRCYYRVVVIQ